MKTKNKPGYSSLLYWLTSIIAYCTAASMLSHPARANATPQVNTAKLVAAAEAFNKAKQGSDAQIQAAYDLCRLTTGPASTPMIVKGQLVCRNLVDASKK